MPMKTSSRGATTAAERLINPVYLVVIEAMYAEGGAIAEAEQGSGLAEAFERILRKDYPRARITQTLERLEAYEVVEICEGVGGCQVARLLIEPPWETSFPLRLLAPIQQRILDWLEERGGDVGDDTSLTHVIADDLGEQTITVSVALKRLEQKKLVWLYWPGGERGSGRRIMRVQSRIGAPWIRHLPSSFNWDRRGGMAHRRKRPR